MVDNSKGNPFIERILAISIKAYNKNALKIKQEYAYNCPQSIFPIHKKNGKSVEVTDVFKDIPESEQEKKLPGECCYEELLWID